MRYISTRGGGEARGFTDILIEGLAPDGGLYVPEKYPRFSSAELKVVRSMTYPQLAFAVLSKFIDDIPAEELRAMIDATYTKAIFGSDDIVPLKKLEDGLFILDLSEGPTLAFKDIALQFLGRLFEYVLRERGQTLNILGATSGDTGSAAEYAMRGRAGVRVFMLSPLDRMSEFQRRQMYTLADKNIFNIAIRGTFDDCQDMVKVVNADAAFKERYRIGAVNSINWARIAAQVVYYFWGYVRVTERNGARVSFSVPSGNFGDVLAGYIAKRTGVPIKHLIVATNENDVLAEFFTTGVYRPRAGSQVAATSSPSMDISKASNFERYIFDLIDRDPERMRELWDGLKAKGSFEVSKPERNRMSSEGWLAGSSTHADRIATIRSVSERYDYLIDPHTADGVTMALRFRQRDVPLICLATALPVKFAATIREAVQREPDVPERFAELAELPERFEVFDADTEVLKRYIAANA